MAEHIADIPKPFYAYVRDEFLYDQELGHGDFTACVAYGLSALPGRAWGISVMLSDGALVQHLPVSAITFTTKPSKTYPLDFLQVWSCYGMKFSTHAYSFLEEMPVLVYLKDGIWEKGRYLFTAAPYGDTYSMTPDQHKHFNFVELDCGLLATMPGNRMLVWDSSFVELPIERPKYRTNTHYWYVEELGDADSFDTVIDPETSL